MAERYIPKGYVKITVEVDHGTINPNSSSTVQVSMSTLGLSSNDIIGGVSVTGAYNSDVIPWSYYIGDGNLTSRLRNIGNNTANTKVYYHILHYKG